jgi:hypothetical protein
MGRMNCRFHGRAGMMFVCLHIHRDVHKKDRMPDVSRITFVDREISDERLRFSETLYYCPVCVSENDLPAENHKMPAQEFSAVYKKVGGLPVCFECYTELTS